MAGGRRNTVNKWLTGLLTSQQLNLNKAAHPRTGRNLGTLAGY
jgi:hypothetical protein